jgi:hypothetical protein
MNFASWGKLARQFAAARMACGLSSPGLNSLSRVELHNLLAGFGDCLPVFPNGDGYRAQQYEKAPGN